MLNQSPRQQYKTKAEANYIQQQTQINTAFALIFQLNWTRIFLMKPHSFTFSRFTTRKTTNHTRNLKQTTRTVRGGLGMRWLRGRGISLRYPFWEDNFLICCLLIGELDPISTDKALLSRVVFLDKMLCYHSQRYSALYRWKMNLLWFQERELVMYSRRAAAFVGIVGTRKCKISLF